MYCASIPTHLELSPVNLRSCPLRSMFDMDVNSADFPERNV